MLKLRSKKSLLVWAIALLGLFITSCDDDETSSAPNGVVSFSSSASSTSEDGAAVNLTIAFSPAAPKAGSVTVTISSATGAVYGTDYTTTPAANGNSITVTIAEGATSAVLTVTPIDDQEVGADQQITFTLSGNSEGIDLGTSLSHTVTITENDSNPSVSFAESTSTINEDGASSTITLNFSAPLAAAGTVTIDVSSATGAVSGTDYTTNPSVNAESITLTADAGATSATITVTPVNDELVGVDDEITFTVSQTSAGIDLGSATTHTLIIVEDDQLLEGADRVEENFDDCTGLPEGWVAYSVLNDELNWACSDFGNNGTTGFTMNGFSGSTQDTEDWLITPAVNMDGNSGMHLFMGIDRRFDGPDLELLYSTDYDGSSDPSDFNWTSVPGFSSPAPANANGVWNNIAVELSGISGLAVYYAFKYTSNTTDGSSRYNIDDVEISNDAFFSVNDADLASFGSVDNGSVSASQSYSIVGGNLVSDITITSSQYFEISSDDANFGTSLTISANDVNAGNIAVFVRFTPASGENGSITGTITHSSEVGDILTSVSGTEAGNEEQIVATGTELYISEYAEGSSNNKYIEIYNPTAEDIDLAGYQLWGSNNGGDWKDERKLQLVGTIAANGVFVIAADQASAEILGKTNMAQAFESPVHYNGNDAVGLFKADGTGGFTLVDVVGVPTEDIQWDVAGVSTATANHTLVRKPEINAGNTNWTTSAGTTAENSEWIVKENDDWTDLGSHTTTAPPLD